MLKHRLISFPLLLLILWAIVWFDWGIYLFTVMSGIFIGMAVYEAARLVKKIGLDLYPAPAGIAAALMTFFPDKRFIAVILFAVLVLIWVMVLLKKSGTVLRLVSSSGVLVMTWIPLVLVANVAGSHGLEVLLFLICATKAMDTGGYIFGMLSAVLMKGGNHKIAPEISPKKSWEGFFGGLLFSLLVGWLFKRYSVMSADTVWFLLTAGLLSVGSFFGDLTESSLKRAAGVKDSGAWIPGMGGALDVLDSFIYNGIIFTVMSCFY